MILPAVANPTHIDCQSKSKVAGFLGPSEPSNTSTPRNIIQEFQPLLSCPSKKHLFANLKQNFNQPNTTLNTEIEHCKQEKDNTE